MSPASTFEEFAHTVSAAMPTLSPQQRVIAQYVLEHPDEFALGTAAAVAEAAGVQPSALVRFANVMEFSGFSEMQQLFRSRLLERAGSYRERIGAMRGNSEADDAEGVLQRFADDGIADLRQLVRSVPAPALERATRLLARARRVHVLAQRRAFPIASYLAYALSQLDLKVNLLDGVGGMLADSMRQFERGEVLLVASFKNYSTQVIEAVQLARAKGLQVVAITDYASSPLKPSASVCFELGHGPSAAFRSLVAPMCLAQALVVHTGQQLVVPQRPRRSRS